MKVNLRGRRTAIASVLTLVAYLLGYATFGAQAKFVVDALLLAVSIIISCTWAPAAWRALRRGASDDVGKVVLTVWLAWSALLIQRVYVIVLAATGLTAAAANSPFPGLIATIILVAGAYAVLAPSEGEGVPRAELINLIAASFVAGVAVCLAVVVLIARASGFVL